MRRGSGWCRLCLVHAAADAYEPLATLPGAVDVTLIDHQCRGLDMGTRVNASTEESEGACYTHRLLTITNPARADPGSPSKHRRRPLDAGGPGRGRDSARLPERGNERDLGAVRVRLGSVGLAL
ncbi:hypothetical protein [Streptomyces sp. NPDC058701]|uniref:hypothetical protein n=1 Tax=Streptomyces sp. NPDC058701 TaxID=3346608 RepID=UPI00365647A8